MDRFRKDKVIHIPELIRLKLRECPEHSILVGSSKLDLGEVIFTWNYKAGACLLLSFSNHKMAQALFFSGVSELYLPAEGGLLSAQTLKILDATQYMPEITAPIRVEGSIEFWASTVTKA